MALSIEQEIELAALTAVDTALSAESGPIEAALGALENNALAALKTLLTNVAKDKIGGLFGGTIQTLETFADSEIEAQAQALLAKYGPAVLLSYAHSVVKAEIAALQKAA